MAVGGSHMTGEGGVVVHLEKIAALPPVGTDTLEPANLFPRREKQKKLQAGSPVIGGEGTHTRRRESRQGGVAQIGKPARE